MSRRQRLVLVAVLLLAVASAVLSAEDGKKKSKRGPSKQAPEIPDSVMYSAWVVDSHGERWKETTWVDATTGLLRTDSSRSNTVTLIDENAGLMYYYRLQQGDCEKSVFPGTVREHHRYHLEVRSGAKYVDAQAFGPDALYVDRFHNQETQSLVREHFFDPDTGALRGYRHQDSVWRGNLIVTTSLTYHIEQWVPGVPDASVFDMSEFAGFLCYRSRKVLGNVWQPAGPSSEEELQVLEAEVE